MKNAGIDAGVFLVWGEEKIHAPTMPLSSYGLDSR
jgi:hypothetical protein